MFNNFTDRILNTFDDLTGRGVLTQNDVDRALREMLSIFRDDPIEGPLQEASMGVWTKILQEES